MVWIQDKRLSLLESCKLDKVHMLNTSINICYSLCIFAKIWRTMMTDDSLKIPESSIFCQSQFVLCNLCMQGLSESYVLAGKMVGS